MSVRVRVRRSKEMTPQNTAKSTAAVGRTRRREPCHEHHPQTAPSSTSKNSRKQSRSRSRSSDTRQDSPILARLSSLYFLRCGRSIVGGALLAQLGRLTIALTKLCTRNPLDGLGRLCDLRRLGVSILWSHVGPTRQSVKPVTAAPPRDMMRTPWPRTRTEK